MKILVAGGGSGGHVTPVLAVLRELKSKDSDLQAYFVCDKGFGVRAKAIIDDSGFPVVFKTIFAGKLRRYHGVSVFRQLMDLPTLFKNLGDILLIGLGFVQSLWHLMIFKPDIVFTKGGFVCLPLGIAASLLKIPLVIHDSDAHPGLTNRVLSRYAAKIATGAPLENYNYPKNKTSYVGIPVGETFKPVSVEQQKAFKDKLGLPDITKPLVVVTGGGLGARRINQAMVSIGQAVLQKASVYHLTGQDGFEFVSQKSPAQADYIVKAFDTDMSTVLGAADVVVTRAGATTMSELAALAKPVVIIPNPMLTGGHQLKNALVYQKDKAALVVDEVAVEKNPLILLDALLQLVDDSKLRLDLGKKLHQFAKPHAAKDMAEIILEVMYAKGRAN